MALFSNCVKEIFTVKELDDIKDTPQYIIEPSLLKKISSTVNPEGVVFLCEMKEIFPKSLQKVVYLDHINDPGNMGTIIRTALAFSYDAVIVSEGSCDIYNEKVIAASKGAIFSLPIIKGNIKELCPNNKLVVSALSDSAVDLHDAKAEEPFALVIGNESNGVSKEILDSADMIVKIKIDNIDSLNAAVAAGILMEHFR